MHKSQTQHLLLNITKDLDINRFLDICKHCNANLFKKVAEWKKEGAAPESARLHVNGKINGISMSLSLAYTAFHSLFRNK